MATSDIIDLIIVGGGPAGLTAGIYGMRAALNTVLVEKGLFGGQVSNTDSVENYPGFESITGFELCQKFQNHAKSYGMEMIQREIVAIEPSLDYHEVRFDNGDVMRGHAVIMAMGGSPRKLGVPGEDAYYGKGVSYCATCDGFFFRGKTVVVVGGGDTAMEEALYLAKLCKRVYLAHRRDAFRASRILQQRVFAECKIEVLWNTVATEIKANDEGVCAVTLQDTQSGAHRELPTDGLFVFVGFLPNNRLVPAGVQMNVEGYVITDGRCETKIQGLYAVGDLREKYARQVVIAAADGCTAALAAAHYVESKKANADTCVLPES